MTTAKQHISQGMTGIEASLLMYLECCCVDYGGSVERRRLNDDDMKIIEKWKESEFISFGRISFKDIHGTRPATHWCELSPSAWLLAHANRKAKSLRTQKNRKWSKTSER